MLFRSASDPDWIAYLDAARSVSPDVLTFDPSLEAENIHRYTFGVKRKVVDLIAIAVRLTRRRSTTATVDSDALLAAYRSADFAMHRDDVEVLFRQQVTGRAERKDLADPFVEIATGTDNVRAIPSAVTRFEKQTEDAILTDALMPSEAAAHKRINEDTVPKPKAGKALRFRTSKISKESLLQGAAELDAFD